MLYLKVAERRISYQAKLAVISIEAALNAVRFACMYFESPEGVTVDDCYLLSHNLLQSICAQSPGLDEPIEDEEGERPDGEWAVRRKISQTIESLQLPYRLDWSLRSNVKDGNVSIDVELTPSRAFAKSAHVDGLGTVETTRDMRRAAASAYALRVAILMAATAFRASKKVLHVWVAGSLETPSHRWCYYTVDFDRWRFSRLDLAHVDDLEAAMRPFVPNMRLEHGFLKPVERTFSPSERRFCPPARYEAVSLSARRLKGDVLRDLPGKTEIVLRVPLGPAEASAYEACRRRAVEALEGASRPEDRMRILAELTRLRRFCCHPSLVVPDFPAAARLFTDCPLR